MKKIITLTVIILTTLVLIALVFDWGRKGNEISNIDQNITASSTAEQNFSSISNMPIVVSYPLDNQEVSSPIKITGKARGSWFFEAVFPIQLIDIEGNIITSTFATAQSDWMTSDFVNFTANVEYDKTLNSGPALIILSKDNPSDNPDFDQSIFIPVVLK